MTSFPPAAARPEIRATHDSGDVTVWYGDVPCYRRLAGTGEWWGYIGWVPGHAALEVRRLDPPAHVLARLKGQLPPGASP